MVCDDEHSAILPFVFIVNSNGRINTKQMQFKVTEFPLAAIRIEQCNPVNIVPRLHFCAVARNSIILIKFWAERGFGKMGGVITISG
jgi:hypothetical protein